MFVSCYIKSVVMLETNACTKKWKSQRRETQGSSYICWVVFQRLECSTRKRTGESGAECEGHEYFSNLQKSLRSLLVLLTTANNPDGERSAWRLNFFS